MSITEQLSQGVETETADETEAMAGELALVIPQDTVLALHGDLGAGKTTFIRGLARAWEINEPVTSPTFNLYTIYEGSRQLIHLDAYRLGSADDLDALMIHDFMHSPWCFAIEWPERISGAVPDDAWHLFLGITDAGKHQIRLEK
ncbi:tRNA (adenosine(37)-N6)-threonylcarbamoyltransferase complex ATPase subunit type 1 TsaE [Coraliomargarita sinensis]|uniref:tRNA threonylcarbamoyladenosine biosynthesis protein TsaE n=1 Tax=Coraliomargarita sinensis TaxID=2174842 RepID=A0A317ZL08_9BACT|nr:tRNA (adenosine(37)-N6)-threonylcarbamoyltransferase complex ATPase subunit type 1 TsaE [Coraliomargarita sinensis]PXA04509.1 tRNA (adenosine(37)-N6)-threonylcarbamoyltransferase complex ATPase subunit type 1 TsaE [Coraliomargarita sinensis]